MPQQLRWRPAMRHSPQTFSPISSAPAGFRSDLPRWQHLVTVDWLAAMLAQQAVEAAPAQHWQLFEAACDGLDAYLVGHIPGAQYLDTRQFEHLPFWNALPHQDMLALLQHLGLGPHSTVILYGRNMLAAARVAQLLLATGVQDVRLLDGGLAAWCDAGQALGHGNACAPAPERAPGPRDWLARPDYLIHTAQVRALLDTAGCALVSIRTRAEFLGETSGYSYIESRGEIAGALWGHAGSDGDVNSMNNFQDALGRMKPAAEIAALWQEAGIRPDLHTTFYCGTGWRASLAFFYAWLMGWERISVYDGGWYEWSADPANPVRCEAQDALSDSRLPAGAAVPEY